jgi:hypothetical protein
MFVEIKHTIYISRQSQNNENKKCNKLWTKPTRGNSGVFMDLFQIYNKNPATKDGIRQLSKVISIFRIILIYSRTTSLQELLY